MSVEDKRALAIMEDSLKIEMVITKWHYPGKNNHHTCLERRLHGLKKRFQQDNALFESYKTTMQGFLERGHASRVADDELDVNRMPLWYLLHHPVFNKPGKKHSL